MRRAGGVVYAVAGHGNDVTFLLQCLHNAKFMFRRYACKDVYIFERFVLIHQWIFFNFRAGEYAPVISDAELTRDLHGGQWVVAGDHDRADASRFATATASPLRCGAGRSCRTDLRG